MASTFDEAICRNFDVASRKEWVLTNGIGGFAMGTIADLNTRRYHGHLVSAVEPPAKRMVLLASLECFVQTDGSPIGLSTNQYPGAVFPQGYLALQSCTVGEAVHWRFRYGDLAVDKILRIAPGSNTVEITYVNEGTDPILLTLRPLVSHKFYHENFSESSSYPQELNFPKNGTQIVQDGVALNLVHEKAQRNPVQGWYYRFEHQREVERGLNPKDDLFCPCELKYELLPKEKAVLYAGSDTEMAKFPKWKPESESGFKLTPQLQAAAQKFVVNTASRTSIIAGYPWFTDWGRDTMIALPGILLCTGRVEEARAILRDYAKQRRQGIIPNRFVDGGEVPDYNTADATLWFLNAVYKTLEKQWDEKFATEMLAVVEDVIDWHWKGTFFGIKADPGDGLLAQGEDGVQLTWMDAKIGDWVVTPRRGKAVEINGLWINGLRIAEWLKGKLGGSGKKYADMATQAEKSFAEKFWSEELGYFRDCVEPENNSLRPNQVIAMALPFAVATGPSAKSALDVVSQYLFTSNGLRTLDPRDPNYKSRYEGPMPQLDAAYHQGTAWPWLLGPYVTALVKITGDRAQGKRIIKVLKANLTECGIHGLAEVYDGDPPQRPNGCPWQAWSVAEVLRAWVEDCAAGSE